MYFCFEFEVEFLTLILYFAEDGLVKSFTLRDIIHDLFSSVLQELLRVGMVSL